MSPPAYRRGREGPHEGSSIPEEPSSFNVRPQPCIYVLVTTRDESWTTREESAAAEEDLLRRALEGDREAAGSLVRRHQGAVYRFLLGFLKDEDLAADVTQDTFLKALERLDSFRAESSLRTWLLVIARNEALGTIRRKGRRSEEPIDDLERRPGGGEAPDVMAVTNQEIARVREALERLPEKQRLSVSLRLFDGLSFREIGEVIESSEGAARVNYHYGIGRLREWLA